MSSAASALLLFFPSKDITVGAAITPTPPYPESDCFNGLLARLVRLLRELHHLHTNSWNSPSPSPDRPRVKRSHGGCYDGKTRFEDPRHDSDGDKDDDKHPRPDRKSVRNTSRARASSPQKDNAKSSQRHRTHTYSTYPPTLPTTQTSTGAPLP